MRVDCPSCSKIYDIPDERLPFGQRIAFPCPACKGIINLDLRSRPRVESSPTDHHRPGTSGPSETHFESGTALKDRILDDLGDLSPMPDTLERARKILADPGSTIREIACVLETDQALAASVLKVANSPFYGRSRKIGNVEQAALLIGRKALNELITRAARSPCLSPSLEGYGMSAIDLWRHALAVAHGSDTIARAKYPEMAGEAFLAGLIHDMGKIILDPHVQRRNELFFQYLQVDDQSFLKVEKQVLGFDHQDIAFEACKRWNLPKAITTAVRSHHAPVRFQQDELACIVHTADTLAIRAGVSAGMDGEPPEFEPKALELLDLGEKDLDRTTEEMLTSVERTSREFAHT